MKTAIIFYSFSGNTKRACLFLKDKLYSKNIAADLIELKPEKEEAAFFKQSLQAFLKHKVDLKKVNYDLSGYEFVIFASPVWAFTIAPALRSYLEKAGNLENKKVVCFLTYHSGIGSGKALKEIENILRESQNHILFSKNLSGSKTKDNNYLEERFKFLLEILTSQ